MASEQKPLIDLDALTDRQTIKVAGTLLVLYTPDELPPLALHRAGVLWRRMSALLATEMLTPDDADELEAIPDQICQIAIAEGDAAPLSTLQKWAVARTFIKPRAEPTPAPVATPNAAPAVLPAHLTTRATGAN